MNIMPVPRRRKIGRVFVPKVTLAHGGGGKAMKDLIDDVFVSAFDNATLAPLEDQARFTLADLTSHGDRLAFTTDSFVVHPLFFPGGDIGSSIWVGISRSSKRPRAQSPEWQSTIWLVEAIVASQIALPLSQK